MTDNDKTKLSLTSNRKGMIARKYHRIVIQRRNKIRILYIRNYSQEEISMNNNISQSTVSRGINYLRERIDSPLENMDQHMLEENFKSPLSLEEQLERLHTTLENPKLVENYGLTAI